MRADSTNHAYQLRQNYSSGLHAINLMFLVFVQRFIADKRVLKMNIVYELSFNKFDDQQIHRLESNNQNLTKWWYKSQIIL